MAIKRLTIVVSTSLDKAIRTAAARAGLSISAHAEILLERGLADQEREDIRDTLDRIETRFEQLALNRSALTGQTQNVALQSAGAGEALAEIGARIFALAAHAGISDSDIEQAKSAAGDLATLAAAAFALAGHAGIDSHSIQQRAQYLKTKYQLGGAA